MENALTYHAMLSCVGLYSFKLCFIRRSYDKRASPSSLSYPGKDGRPTATYPRALNPKLRPRQAPLLPDQTRQLWL